MEKVREWNLWFKNLFWFKRNNPVTFPCFRALFRDISYAIFSWVWNDIQTFRVRSYILDPKSQSITPHTTRKGNLWLVWQPAWARPPSLALTPFHISIASKILTPTSKMERFSHKYWLCGQPTVEFFHPPISIHSELLRAYRWLRSGLFPSFFISVGIGLWNLEVLLNARI